MRETDLLQFYITQLLAILATPLGAFGLFLLIATVVLAIVVPAMRWVFVTCVIYMATVPLVTTTTAQYTTLAFPLEQLRSFGRPLIYLLLSLMLLPLASSHQGWRHRLIALPLLVLLAFELHVALRLLAFGNVARGMFSALSYSLILLTLGIGLARWLQTLEDLYKLVWCLSIAGGLVALATVYQLAVNRQMIINNGRLIGFTGNQQFLGIFLAYTLPFTFQLLIRGGRYWVKPLLILQITVMLTLLIWTGSRTGALATVTSLAVLFHRRLGKFVVVGAVVAAAVFVAMPFFEGSSEIAARLVWTTNTRAGAWAQMSQNFMQAPLFGVSSDSFETAESSYLAALSQFGLVGALPLFIAVGLMFRQLLALNRLRSRLGPERSLVDMTLAIWTAIAVTTVFEGLLMGVITYPIMMIYAVSTMTTFLQDWAQTDETYAMDPAVEYAAAA